MMIFQGNYSNFLIPGPLELRDWILTVGVNDYNSYGRAVNEYASAWANLMEKKIKQGHRLQDIAEESSHEANTQGITGFMYGCAVSILSQVWTHGEELRRWHNLNTQLDTEGEVANETGGTLNPAVMRISL